MMDNTTPATPVSAENVDVSQFSSVAEMKKATGLPYSKCYYLMKLKGKSKKA